MPELFTCSQGHQWESSCDVLTLATDAPVSCPVCGASVTRHTLSAVSEETSATLSPGQMPPVVDTVQTPTLASSALPRETFTPELPTVPGYEILGVLGRGGMGVVYKARQIDLNRLVALKMISAGAHSSPQQLARFHLEAEAVASLQHPNIVQLYEVSAHNQCPYFSLEFMDGGSLDEKLGGKAQPPRPAAELVETLARAMHGAHQRGVIHRDLKPANILLTAQGVAKITDFGLAKRLEGTSQTKTGEILGTPSYMAPEQVTGNPKEIDPATDVYALGAILYELLTGRPPFRATTTMETLQQVQFQEPAPLARWGVKVPRDLETICLKCLEKQPAKRYASAEALADDLHRFLTDEPVRARPVSSWERMAKWVRRRPAAAALIVVTGLAVVSLTAGLTWHTVRLRSERDYAERNLRRALQAVDQMLTEVAEEQLAYEPRMEEKRRALLARALHFYKEFLEEKRTDPAVRKETGLAYKRMGDILRMLEQYDHANEAYAQAITLLDQLAADFPSEPDYQQQLAACHNFLGEVLRKASRPREAGEAYHRALQLQQRLVGEYAAHLAYQQDLARTHYNLGILLQQDNHLEDAEKAFIQSITVLEQLVARDAQEPRYQQHLARSYFNLGPVLRTTHRPQQARERYDQAIAVLEKLAAQYPDIPNYRHELGVCFLNLGNLLAGSNSDRAEDAYSEALKRFQCLASDFPRVPVYRQELANVYNSLGSLLVHKENRSAAQEAWGTALVLFHKLAAERPDVPAHRADLGMAYGNLGWLLTDQKDWTAARPQLEKAVACLKNALKPPNARNPDYLSALHDCYQSLAETLVQLKEPVAAAEAAAALPEVFQDRGLDFYYAACFVARCVPLAKEPALQHHYTDQTINLLRRAVARGVDQDKRLQEIEKNYLKPLRPAVIGNLLAELDGRTTTQPGGPPR